MWGDAEETDEEELIDLSLEVDEKSWEPRSIALPPSWRPIDWAERPIRFIDGKDVGETVTCLTSPDGYPVPVRLSEIGSVVVEVRDGQCRRTFSHVERVVSMVVDQVFPWHEVEAFASSLQDTGMTLLWAQPPEGKPSYDLEKMRKASQNRSMDEMVVLEGAAVLRDTSIPTIVDGRLEPRLGGPEASDWPVFGVIKTQRKTYLHSLGMQVLYRLAPGQRTPAFTLPDERLPVISWYVRLDGGPGMMPNWGLVRVEAPLRWFERTGRDWSIIDQLSRTVHDYRCREQSYGRAPVSLHPIVRAEELLGALFSPRSMLANRFYRLAGL
jgi:hypothetical protein